MSHNTHDIGDKVRVDTADHSAEPGGVDGRFTNASTGAPIDPTVVKLSINKPVTVLGVTTRVTTTYTYPTDAIIVRDGTGAYHADIDVDEAGTWWYRWFSTGTGQAADEKRFKVREANAV